MNNTLKKAHLYIRKPLKPDPDFGRLLTAFERKEPDRVPLMELLVDEEVKAAFLGHPVADMRDEVEFWLATGYDYVPLFVLNLTPGNISVIDSHTKTYQQGLQERARIGETERIITTQEDFNSCLWPEIHDALFDNFEDVRRYLPPEMKVIGCIASVFQTVTQAMGLQTFCVNIYDRPDLIDAMFKRTGILITQCIELLLQFDCVGAIWIADDLACNQGPIISPIMFRKYVFPWYKKYTEMVHSRGLPVLLHTCGNPTVLFEDIIEAGFDALHPLQENAVDIYEVKRQIGDRMCLCGNIDLSYELARASTDEVVEDVKDHLRTLAPGGGYCLGSSHSIANCVPLDRYLAMNRACLEFGTYPITL